MRVTLWFLGLELFTFDASTDAAECDHGEAATDDRGDCTTTPMSADPTDTFMGFTNGRDDG